MSHPGDAQGHLLLPSKTSYTTGGHHTAPTAYPTSSRAYPLVPCVPSKLTQATGRTQQANKEGPCVQGTQGGISANQLISKYSEYRGPYVVMCK